MNRLDAIFSIYDRETPNARGSRAQRMLNAFSPAPRMVVARVYTFKAYAVTGAAFGFAAAFVAFALHLI